MRMGSPGSGELLDAHAALHETQNFFAAEIIRGPGAHVAARADFHHAAPRLAQGLDLLAEEAVEFGVRVAGQQPFARRELHGVGQRLVEFFENGRPPSISRPANCRSNSAGRRSRSSSSAAGMQAPQAREIGGLLEPALAHASRVDGSSSRTPIFTHSSRMRLGW